MVSDGGEAASGAQAAERSSPLHGVSLEELREEVARMPAIVAAVFGKVECRKERPVTTVTFISQVDKSRGPAQ